MTPQPLGGETIIGEIVIDLHRYYCSGPTVKLVRGKYKKKSKPSVGDYGALHVKGVGWVVLRVVGSNPSLLWGESESEPETDAYLVYVYSGVSSELPELPMSEVAPKLLLPPIIVHSSLWTEKFVTPLGPSKLLKSELLPVHCFWHCLDESDEGVDIENAMFQNEHGERLDSISLPCATLELFFAQGVAEWLGTVLQDGFDQDSHPLS